MLAALLRPRRLRKGGARLLLAAGLVLALPGSNVAATPLDAREHVVDLRAFRVIDSESGPLNYYTSVGEPPSHIHAAYPVGAKTTVLGYRIPESKARAVASVKWKWRAVQLPAGGNECADGKGDSAAAIYVTWKRGLRWYTVKYVWSAVGPKGSTCRRKRNLFRAQDTVVVESGPPLDEWRTVTIEPDREYRNHFEDGNPRADVPALIGIGIMSDGDQTRSRSSADYGEFVLGWK